MSWAAGWSQRKGPAPHPHCPGAGWGHWERVTQGRVTHSLFQEPSFCKAGQPRLQPALRQLQDSRYWERSLSTVQALPRWWTQQEAALNGARKLLSSVGDPPALRCAKRGAVSLSRSSEEGECLGADSLAGSAPPEVPLPQCCCLGGWEAAVPGCFCLGPARRSTACSCSEGGQGGTVLC